MRFIPLCLAFGLCLSLTEDHPVIATPIPAEVVQRDVVSSGALLARIPASSMDASVASERAEGTRAEGLRAGWRLQQTVSKVLMGISFCDAQNGYACAELGGVYRTTNGGTNWSTVMNVGFPYYWYGVHAFSATTAVVAGFQNQTGAGILRWTTDGGATWTPDIILDPANWLLNVAFADANHGIAYGYQGCVYVTQNGGRTASDWTKIQADPTAGWFAGNLDVHPDGRAWVTGVSFCASTDFGATWNRRGSIDGVFDGGVCFTDVAHGWTGGGQISAPVSGWVHRTNDGGASWSARILQPTYPIRIVKFFDDRFGFAAGGTRFNNAGGGIWLTTDAGGSWALDVDTGAEMSAIDAHDVSADSTDVWCVGFLPNFTGVIYKKRIARRVPAGIEEPDVVERFSAPRPNPFADRVTVAGTGATAEVFDFQGRKVRTLRSDAGRFVWDGRDEAGHRAAAGIYLIRVDGVPGGVRVVRIN
jgi:photosystem II stability/assembly factor-like uncharacterized protein